jgi:hypothetical protein
MIFLVLFATSCGKVEVTGGTGVGEIKNVSPLVVGQSELSIISSICQAIAQKTAALPSYINAPATFSYSRKSCSDKTFGTASDVNATIQSTASGFKFVLSGGVDFYFSDLETTDHGSMSQICQQLSTQGTLTSPINYGSEYIFFTTSGISGADCSPLSLENCIYIEKGSADGSGQAKIHTKEWSRYRVQSYTGRVGFFTSKKQLTSLSCPDGSTSGNMATLK